MRAGSSVPRAGRQGELDEILGYHLEQAYRYRSELGPTGEGRSRAGHARGRGLWKGRPTSTLDVGRDESSSPRAVSLLPGNIHFGELLTELGSALMLTGIRPCRGVLEEAVTAAAAGRRHSARGSCPDRARVPQDGCGLGGRGPSRLRRSPVGRSISRRPAIPGLARAPATAQRGRHSRRPLGRGRRRSIAHWVMLEGGRPPRGGNACSGPGSLSLYSGPTPVDEAIVRCEDSVTPRSRAPLARMRTRTAGGCNRQYSRRPARDAWGLRRGSSALGEPRA